MNDQTTPAQAELYGHPTGLFTLFFAEMWERFSYYGMRALLVFYMIKSFGFADSDAYAIYGAYTALVYMTPFFGGMIADRLLGQRSAVLLGGSLMAAGHLVMTVEYQWAFYIALGLLIVGNGFFKPNISTIVGKIYRPGDARRDGGFTIFYMGINLGAALAPLICGYVGETFGWHWGFGLATVGMLIGLAVFWAPPKVAQALILGGAIFTAFLMIVVVRDKDWLFRIIYSAMALALVASGWVAFRAVGLGGIPRHLGLAPNPEALKKPVFAGISARNAVFLGTLLTVPIFALLVSRGRHDGFIAPETIKGFMDGNIFLATIGILLKEVSKPAGLILTLAGAGSLFYLIKETFGLDKVAKERMFVVLILTFFSFLFWAFFEQAGSSISVFTDRNVDRVQVERTLTAGDVGTTIEFRVPLDTTEEDLKKLPPLTQAQLGWPAPVALRPVIADAILRDVNDENKAKAEKMKEVQEIADSAREAELFTISGLTALRSMAAKQDALESDKKISWSVTAAMVGMEIGESETPASIFQAANPGFILIFGLIFTWLWAFMAARGKEPSTPFKFALGLLQLGLGFVALWMGANSADDRGMVGVSWLLLGYLLHTTGELCLSPVGLSMVTKLSPARLVSTVMGAWFLATAMSNLLASIIAQFTGIESSEGENTILPAPTETVNVYGDVYNKIAIASIVSAVICFLLVPKLKVWMHPEVDTE